MAYDDSKITDFQISASDLSLISKRLLSNENLCKLLYFSDTKPYGHELTDEIKAQLFADDYIAIIPRIYASTFNKSGVVISFDNFISGSDTNPAYMNCVVIFDILVPLSEWKIKSALGKTTLRPYEIAHEIHKQMNGAALTGIGKAIFANGSQILLPANEDVAGLTIRYTLEASDNDGWKLRNR